MDDARAMGHIEREVGLAVVNLESLSVSGSTLSNLPLTLKHSLLSN